MQQSRRRVCAFLFYICKLCACAMSSACAYCKLVHSTENQIAWCKQNRAVCHSCQATGIITWDNYSHMHGQPYCEFCAKWLLPMEREVLETDTCMDVPPSSPQEEMTDLTCTYSHLCLDQ